MPLAAADAPVGTERDAVHRAGVRPERLELARPTNELRHLLPAATVRPLGLNATLSTMRTRPLSVPAKLSRRRSHNWTVPFSVAVARVCPLGLNAMLLTGPA